MVADTRAAIPFVEKRAELLGVVVTGVVEDDDHLPAGGAAPQKQAEEPLELVGVEDRREGVGELAGAQADGAEAGDRLARRRVPRHGVLVLGRHPHAAPAAVPLEVALVLAAQVDVVTRGQETQFS